LFTTLIAALYAIFKKQSEVEPMFRHAFGIVVSYIVTVVPLAANATISNVVGPVVKKGSSQIEYRSSYSFDGSSATANHRYRQRVHYDYGVTDWLALRAIVFHERQENDGFKHRATSVEARMQLIKRSETLPVDAGIRLIYSGFDSNYEPDTIATALIADYYSGNMLYRSNLFLSNQIRKEAQGGIRAETRWRAAYDTNGYQRIGLEMINQFGQINNRPDYKAQQHQIGPVWLGRISKDSPWGFQLGAMAGISKAASDLSTKAYLSYNF
jgi:hypothetical protein